MLVLALGWESSINPVLLTSGIVPHVCVAHLRQFTGGVLRSISSRLSTVNHDVSRLIGQKARCDLLHLIGRQIDRAGKMRMLVSGPRQRLN